MEKDLNERKAARSAKKQKKLSLTSIKKKSKGSEAPPAELGPPAAEPAKDAKADAGPAKEGEKKEEDKKDDKKEDKKDDSKKDDAKDGEEKKE